MGAAFSHFVKRVQEVWGLLLIIVALAVAVGKLYASAVIMNATVATHSRQIEFLQGSQQETNRILWRLFCMHVYANDASSLGDRLECEEKHMGPKDP